MSQTLRQIILQQVSKKEDTVSEIISNALKSQMKYNLEYDRFEIKVHELGGGQYFSDNPDQRVGAIEGTSVHWQVKAGSLYVWMEV